MYELDDKRNQNAPAEPARAQPTDDKSYHNTNDFVNLEKLPTAEEILEAALEYGQRWAIFPCQHRRKEPATRNGFKDASREEAQIRRWWPVEKEKPFNIGLPTGKTNNLTVLDVDGLEGEKALEALSEIAGSADWLNTRKVQTGKGFQLYFDHVPGLKNRARLMPGLDIRNDGGYVVAPPSIHPSGIPYQLVRDIPQAELPAKVAAHLLALQNKKPLADPKRPPDEKPKATANAPAIARILKKLEIGEQVYDFLLSQLGWPEKKARPKYEGEAAPSVAQGQRNDHLTRLGGSLRNCNLPEGTLEAALQKFNTLYCDPPLPEHEVTTIANSVNSMAITPLSTRSSGGAGVETALANDSLPAFDGASTLILPDGYVIENGSLWHVRENKKGEPTYTLVSHSPVLATEYLEDQSGEENYIKVVFLLGKKWHSIETTIANFVKRDRLENLSNTGLPVDSSTSKELAKYMGSAIAWLRRSQEPTRIATVPGWHEKEFLTATGGIGTGDGPPLRYQPRDRTNLLAGYHAHGNLNNWFEVAKPLLDLSEVARVALYAALAPPLLKITGCPNVILDLSCRTTTGKTSALLLAASAVGDPGSIVRAWDTTKVGLETSATEMNDHPTFLDDTMQAQKKESLHEFIYSFVNGCGKSRGSRDGSARAVTKWRGVLISTGESAITDYSQAGGTRGRVLQIKRLPFGDQSEKVRTLLRNFDIVSRKNYGYLWPMMLEFLVKNSVENIKKYFEQQYSTLGAQPGVIARLAQSAALITTAGKLIHQVCPELGEFKNPFAGELWSTIVEDAAMADMDVRALDCLQQWAVANKSRFFVPVEIGDTRYKESSTQEEPLGGWAGVWPTIGFVGFLESTLKKALHEMGFDWRACVRAWADRGYILTSSDRKRLQKTVRIGGILTRVIAVKNECLFPVEKNHPVPNAVLKMDIICGQDAPITPQTENPDDAYLSAKGQECRGPHCTFGCFAFGQCKDYGEVYPGKFCGRMVKSF